MRMPSSSLPTLAAAGLYEHSGVLPGLWLGWVRREGNSMGLILEARSSTLLFESDGVSASSRPCCVEAAGLLLPTRWADGGLTEEMRASVQVMMKAIESSTDPVVSA